MEYISSQQEYRKQLYLTGAKLVHFVASCLLFYLSWLLFRYNHIFPVHDEGFRYNYYAVMGYGVFLFFFNRTYNSYLLGYRRIRELILAEILAQFFSTVIIYIIVSIGWNQWRFPYWLILMLVIDLGLDVIWSWYVTLLYFRLYARKKTILIYRNKVDRYRFGTLRGKPSERVFKVTEELMYDGSFGDLEERLKGYDAIFVSGVNSKCRNGILKYCKENAIPGFFLPHVGDVIMQESVHIQSFDSPVLCVTGGIVRPEYIIVKRIIDFCISLLGIIVLSPFMLVIAIAIKAYDKGPVIFKQVRLTQGGKKFKIYKFRSMKVDAEEDGVARLSSGDNDDRITLVGKFIRKYRLDELPQLFNIIAGDMSIVGPRPERPEIAEQYYKTLPEFKLRLQVKAGLTGYAQVYGKYNTDPYEKLEFDLLYINNMSILTDVKLMFATIATIISSEGIDGVSKEQTTAMPQDNED